MNLVKMNQRGDCAGRGHLKNRSLVVEAPINGASIKMTIRAERQRSSGVMAGGAAFKLREEGECAC